MVRSVGKGNLVVQSRGSFAEFDVRSRSSDVALLSTDVFDTILLRDGSSETRRLERAARRAARGLGMDREATTALVRLRWDLQRSAYLAVAAERPTGEATLTAVCRVAAQVFARPEVAGALRRAEVEVDAEHLAANEQLLQVLVAARRRGTRVVAVSDTYYSSSDIRSLMSAVLGSVPYDEVYSSADIGLTKHASVASGGGLYAQVARAENVEPARVLHVGDLEHVDGAPAAAAGWRPVVVPREAQHRARKLVGAVTGLSSTLRRFS